MMKIEDLEYRLDRIVLVTTHDPNDLAILNTQILLEILRLLIPKEKQPGDTPPDVETVPEIKTEPDIELAEDRIISNQEDMKDAGRNKRKAR